MSTLKELIYNVRNPNSGGRGNRALTVTDRQIAFWIKEARAAILNQYGLREKNKGIDLDWEQDLGCVTLHKVDQADCAKFEWGDMVKYADIPATNFITFFGLIDKRTVINLPEQNFGSLNDFLPYKKKNFYEGQRIGTRIYIYPAMLENSVLHNAQARTAVSKLCTVNIRGVWDDPTLVEMCGADGIEKVCFDWDTTCYPFPAAFEGQLYAYINKNYIFPQVQFPQDVTNDELKQSVL